MSVGTVVTAFLLLAVFAFLYIILGVGVEKVYEKNNDMIASGEPYSQNRQTAMNNLFIEWYAYPVIIVILILFWAIKNAIADKDNVI